MGGEGSARIHPGAAAGELVTWEGLVGHRCAALGLGKRKRGSRKPGPTKERVGMGPISLRFLFTCIFNDLTQKFCCIFKFLASPSRKSEDISAIPNIYFQVSLLYFCKKHISIKEQLCYVMFKYYFGSFVSLAKGSLKHFLKSDF